MQMAIRLRAATGRLAPQAQRQCRGNILNLAWNRNFVSSMARSFVTITHRQPPGGAKDSDGDGDKYDPGGGGGDKDRSMDIERHLSGLQRSVVELYRSGDYSRALEIAQHAQRESAEYFGKGHPVVASSWNNIALMHKMLGQYDEAIQAYLMATETYRETAGDHHPQFISTLANLGMCFQAAALAPKSGRSASVGGGGGGLDRAPLLERAVETLEEVVKLRSRVEVSYSDSGGSHESTAAQARMQLAMARFHAIGSDAALPAAIRARQAERRQVAEKAERRAAAAAKRKRQRMEEASDFGQDEDSFFDDDTDDMEEHPQHGDIDDKGDANDDAHLIPPAPATEREAIEFALAATEECLAALRQRFGDAPLDEGKGRGAADIAAALNNKGFLFKIAGTSTDATAEAANEAATADGPSTFLAQSRDSLFQESLIAYEKALLLREGSLGSSHSDTLATKHNLAELLIVRGDEAAAAMLQQEILDALGVEEQSQENAPGELPRPMNQ